MDALELRLVAAQVVFENARNHIRGLFDTAVIGQYERDDYLAKIDKIEPDRPELLNIDNVQQMEAAVVALRDAAIDGHIDGDYCHDGLSRFLEAAGLDPFDDDGCDDDEYEDHYDTDDDDEEG